MSVNAWLQQLRVNSVRRRRILLLLQLRVFCLGFFQDGNVGIGILPRGEEILVGGACARSVVLCGQRPREPELRERIVEIQGPQAAARQELAELRDGFARLPGGKVGLAAQHLRAKFSPFFVCWASGGRWPGAAALPWRISSRA